MRLSLTLPDPLYKTLQHIAAQEHTTIANLLREAAYARTHGNLNTRITRLEQHTGLKPPPPTTH